MIKNLFIFLFVIGCQQREVTFKKDHSRAAKKKLVVCSQNLARYGENKNNRSQLHYLIKRIHKADCSIIALQEISLKKPQAIHDLAKVLSGKIGRKFEPYVGKSRDNYIANGFLVAEDLGKVKSVHSYWNKGLPKINPYGPARNFTRGPVLMQVELAPEYQIKGKKYLDVFSIHLKSRRNGWKDPAKMNFEIQRVESAQAIREFALEQASAETLVLVMGDRNNDKDRASDEVLEGRVELSDLRKGGSCELTQNEVALCKKTREPKLVGLFGLRLDRFPGQYPKGSYLYRGKESLLDEVFIRPEDLEFVTKSDNTLSIGYQGEYFKGSDHKLLHVTIWSQGNVD